MICFLVRKITLNFFFLCNIFQSNVYLLYQISVIKLKTKTVTVM